MKTIPHYGTPWSVHYPKGQTVTIQNLYGPGKIQATVRASGSKLITLQAERPDLEFKSNDRVEVRGDFFRCGIVDRVGHKRLVLRGQVIGFVEVEE